MRIHYLQQVPFEDPAYFFEWAKKNNVPITGTHCYREATYPDISSFDCLLIMGGPMSIHDEIEYPWLSKEKIVIKSCLDAGKKIIGICLGAQLLAEILGATVMQNDQKEIGFFPIQFNAPKLGLKDETLLAFHWHGETFNIPEGANHLAESEACKNQAFMYKDQVLAFQFHLESTTESIHKLIDNCRTEIIVDSYVQDENTMLNQLHQIKNINQSLDQILQHFCAFKVS